MAVLRSLLLPLVVHLASCEVHASSSAEGPLEPGNRTSRIPLNFILMLSNSSSYNSWGSIPAVDIALEMVDESGLLGEYKLQYSTPGLDSHVRSFSVHITHTFLVCRKGALGTSLMFIVERLPYL